MLCSVNVDENSRIPHKFGAGIVPVSRQSVISKMIASCGGKVQPPTTIQKQDALPGGGKNICRHPATGSCSGDHHVPVAQRVTSNPTVCHPLGCV